MKGKSNFTKSECVILKRLIKCKVNSNKSEQKNIRNEMRDMNFYISDFTDKKGFDVDDFSQLIEDGKITIVEDEDISIEDGRSQELSNKSQSRLLHSMKNCACLEAYVPASPRILILGTMPGKESLRLQQYYANRSNRFWKIIAKAADKPLPEDYSKRLRLLDQLHIALWDVYASAERKGSLDSNIKNGEQNDVQSLINSNPSIKKVLFNGGKAYRKALDYGCLNVEMPSTSSANTHLTQEELFSIWVKEIKEK